MKFANRIIAFVKPRLTRLLFLAAIIVAFNMTRLSAFAKYNSYIADYTSAVAGDFFFKSNYLFSKAEKKANYSINSWDGQDYNIDLSVYNYENSLRYNHEGTDFFYEVNAAMYKDEECTIPDSSCEVNVYYIKGASGSEPERTDAYAAEKDGKQYGLLRGMKNFDKPSGEQKVRVTTHYISPVTDKYGRYLKITACTVPLSEMSGLTMVGGIEKPTTKEGIYYGELSEIFNLQIPDNDAEIIANFLPGTDYKQTFRIICKKSSAASSRVKVYYDPSVLVPDPNAGTYITETEEGNVFKGWRYVITNVAVGSYEDIVFYKTNAGADVHYDRNKSGKENSLGYALWTGSDDDTKYQLVTGESEHGTVTGIYVMNIDGAYEAATEAVLGSSVKITTQPEEDYLRNGLRLEHDTTVGDIPVQVVGEEYYFTMPPCKVTVVGLFEEKPEEPASESDAERESESESESESEPE